MKTNFKLKNYFFYGLVVGAAIGLIVLSHIIFKDTGHKVSVGVTVGIAAGVFLLYKALK